MTTPTPTPEQMADDKQQYEAMKQYAAEIDFKNGLAYAKRVNASPESFHEDEQLLARAVKAQAARIGELEHANTLMAQKVEFWQDAHDVMKARAEAAERALLAAQAPRPDAEVELATFLVEDCIAPETEALRIAKDILAQIGYSGLLNRLETAEARIGDLEQDRAAVEVELFNTQAEAKHNLDGWNSMIRVGADYLQRAEAAERALLAAQAEAAVLLDALDAYQVAKASDAPDVLRKWSALVQIAIHKDKRTAAAQSLITRLETAEARIKELEDELNWDGLNRYIIGGSTSTPWAENLTSITVWDRHARESILFIRDYELCPLRPASTSREALDKGDK